MLFTSLLIAMCTIEKKKNNQICIFYMRLNNLKFSKHTMD